MANRRGKTETVTDFISLGSKITADSDYSPEIKRYLLLGKKAMTNLASVSKSRDSTLPTKICTVKAMILPVVMYRCERWTIKKAEHQRTHAFKLRCWRRFLRVHWNARCASKSILKETNPEYSLQGLTLKRLSFDHPMWRADSLEKSLIVGKIESRRRRGWQRMRWLDNITGIVSLRQWTRVWTNPGR